MTTLTDLCALARVAVRDELPDPISVTWDRAGIEVHISAPAHDAWLGSTDLDVEQESIETRLDGHVVTDEPRRVAGVSIRLRHIVPVDRQAWGIHSSSSLTYEEATRWLAEWPSLNEDQQRREHADMVREQGVPASLLPELPEGVPEAEYDWPVGQR